MHDLAPADRMFLTFRVQGRRYGIDVAHVREVGLYRGFSPVPQAPAIVRGLTNLRSQIYLVLDAGAALGGARCECSADSRLIVLQQGVAENLAILVDHGGDIVRVPASRMEEAAPGATAEAATTLNASPVVALCKLDGELLMVVDPRRMIAALEIAIR